MKNGQNGRDRKAHNGKAMASPAAGRVYGMNLTNVARSSLDECRKDYIKYLVRRGLRQWQVGDPAFDEVRNLRPQSVEECAAWVSRPDAAEPIEERAANLGAILATQAHWLTERLLDRHARDFEAGGGFSERLYRARTSAPCSSDSSVPSVSTAAQNKEPLTKLRSTS